MPDFTVAAHEAGCRRTPLDERRRQAVAAAARRVLRSEDAALELANGICTVAELEGGPAVADEIVHEAVETRARNAGRYPKAWLEAGAGTLAQLIEAVRWAWRSTT